MDRFEFLQGWYMDVYIFTKVPEKRIMDLLSKDPNEKERAFWIAYEKSYVFKGFISKF
jgi:hypothetical protein